MSFQALGLKLVRMATPFPLYKCTVDAQEWQRVAILIAQSRGRLVSLWGRESGGSSFAISALYFLDGNGLLWLELPLKSDEVAYPEISSIFPAASRMQRAVYDLLGIKADSAPDTRPWLSHGGWSEGFFPLRKNSTGDGVPPNITNTKYDFVEVAGIGVHEIAVGPVHAGIIEPGHFRFSVVGEKTLRLEERLGYTHKGVDRRFPDFQANDGHRLAGRMSGDSTVAYSWAYCMALESAWGWKVPERAISLRAIFLERERIANHLGDLGAL
ncbi:MAG: NADH-quinone oxidoreductase subunit C, partial [Actinobacteria bacterium]|nr:NADH-quinone oxidoreductase subunit C [Actinomycetota bacterium]